MQHERSTWRPQEHEDRVRAVESWLFDNLLLQEKNVGLNRTVRCCWNCIIVTLLTLRATHRGWPRCQRPWARVLTSMSRDSNAVLSTGRAYAQTANYVWRDHTRMHEQLVNTICCLLRRQCSVIFMVFVFLFFVCCCFLCHCLFCCGIVGRIKWAHSSSLGLRSAQSYFRIGLRVFECRWRFVANCRARGAWCALYWHMWLLTEWRRTLQIGSTKPLVNPTI